MVPNLPTVALVSTEICALDTSKLSQIYCHIPYSIRQWAGFIFKTIKSSCFSNWCSSRLYDWHYPTLIESQGLSIMPRARWIISRSEPQAMLKLSIMWALRIVSAFVKKKKTHSSNSQGCHPARKWNCCCRFSSAWAIIYLLLLWRRWLQNTRPAGTVAPPIFSLSLYPSISFPLSVFVVVPRCAHFKKHCVGFWRLFPMANFYDSLPGMPASCVLQKKKKIYAANNKRKQ